MSALDQVVKDADVQPQQELRPFDLLHRRAYVGGQLPARMNAKEVAEQFSIGLSRFYELVKQGKFDQFELLPRIGARAWSGKLLMQYFDGQAVVRRNR